MNILFEKDAKKKACPYDGKPCGVSGCMAWVKEEELRTMPDQPRGYCARIHNST